MKDIDYHPLFCTRSEYETLMKEVNETLLGLRRRIEDLESGYPPYEAKDEIPF